MAIEGPLRELALTDVFQLLDLSRKTGTLTVRPEGRDSPAVIRFDRGAVVGADLAETTGQIGHLLLRAGKVTERAIERARREQQLQPGRPLGALLVELGYVSEDDLRKQLRFQIEQTIYELIRWKDGYFRFEEGAAIAPGTLVVRVPTESLLMEAARRIDEWTTLEPKVPSMSVVPRLVGGEAEGAPTLDLHPSEWEVLAEIDGERTLKRISTELGRSDFDVAKIVFGLVSTGVVEILEPDETPRPALRRGGLRESLAEVEQAVRDRDLPRACAVLEALAQEHPHAPEVPYWQGLAHAAAERWSDAAASLAVAVQMDPLGSAPHYQLGFAAARSGDLSRAEEAWTTYLRLPETPARQRATAAAGLEALAALRDVLRRAEP
jgi:hypothetical protein